MNPRVIEKAQIMDKRTGVGQASDRTSATSAKIIRLDEYQHLHVYLVKRMRLIFRLREKILS